MPLFDKMLTFFLHAAHIMAGNEALAFSSLRSKRSYKRLRMSRETQATVNKIEKQIMACDEAMEKAEIEALSKGSNIEDNEDYKENRTKSDELRRMERLITLA